MSAEESTGVLLTEAFLELYGGRLEGALDELGSHRLLVVREGERLSDDELAAVDIAFFSRDSYVAGTPTMFEAITRSARLRWLHVFHAGVNGPRYQGLLERGVTLTTSSGSHAEPIAQTAMLALLWFARGFGHWQQAQRERRWARVVTPDEPRDLRGQTLVVIGAGAIGGHAGRIAQALGLHVVGVRRSPRRSDDHVDELHPPSALPELLPRADWLLLSCPLTEQTRGMIDETALALLPGHAHVLNVSRGAVIDEPALIRALEQGRLAGAYLDVFEQEPLPADSPLWDMPGVLITPHNSAVSSGNDDRAVEIFLDNLVRWHAGRSLTNHVTAIE